MRLIEIAYRFGIEKFFAKSTEQHGDKNITMSGA
jgi:hypothetical protein